MYIFYHFSILRLHRWLKSFLVKDQGAMICLSYNVNAVIAADLVKHDHWK